MAGPAILLEIITYIFQCTPPTCECDEPLRRNKGKYLLILMDTCPPIIIDLQMVVAIGPFSYLVPFTFPNASTAIIEPVF